MNDVDAGWKHSLALEGYDPNDPNYTGYVWAWGTNRGYAFGEYFFGILGTGSEYWNLQQKTLVSVHDGAMDTESDRLENINEIAAGWMHSLALDVNDSVWSWGWNAKGQLGIGT
jgi:alpha-tubulin suppressor-like RCC1 family protein